MKLWCKMSFIAACVNSGSYKPSAGNGCSSVEQQRGGQRTWDIFGKGALAPAKPCRLVVMTGLK